MDLEERDSLPCSEGGFSPPVSLSPRHEVQSGSSFFQVNAPFATVAMPVRLTAAALDSNSHFLGVPGSTRGCASTVAGAARDASMCATDGGDCEVDSSVGGACYSTQGFLEHKSNRFCGEECDHVRGSSESDKFGDSGDISKGDEGQGQGQDLATEIGLRGTPQWPLEGEGQVKGRKLRDDRTKSRFGTCALSPERFKPTLVSISAEDRDRLLLDTGVTLEEAEERWWKGLFQDQETVVKLANNGVNTLADWIQDAAVDAGEKPFLISAESNMSLSYRHVNERSNAVAVWAHKDRRGAGTLEVLLREGTKNLIIDEELAQIPITVPSKMSPAEDSDKAPTEGNDSEKRTPSGEGKGDEGKIRQRRESWVMVPDPAFSADAERGQAALFNAEKGQGAACEPACGQAPLREGAVVALVMSTSVESIILLLGLLKACLVVALIPPHLKGTALFQAISAAKPTCIFVDDEHLPALRELYGLKEQQKQFTKRNGEGSPDAAAIRTKLRGDGHAQAASGGTEAKSLWEKTFLPSCPRWEKERVVERPAGKQEINERTFPVFVYGEATVSQNCPPNTQERNLLEEIREATSASVGYCNWDSEPGKREADFATDEKMVRPEGTNSDRSPCTIGARVSPARRRSMDVKDLLLPPCSPSLGVVFNLPTRMSSSSPLCWACLEPGDSESSQTGDTTGALIAGEEQGKTSQARSDAVGCAVARSAACAVCGHPGQGTSRHPRPSLYVYVTVPSPQNTKSHAEGGDGQAGETGQGVRAETYAYNPGEEERRLAPVKLSAKTVISFGVTWARHMDLTDNDVVYCPLGIQEENGGLAIFAAAVQARASIVFPRQCSPSCSAFWRHIDNFQCTYTAYCPRMWANLFDELPTFKEETGDSSVEKKSESERRNTSAVPQNRRLRGCVGYGMTSYIWSRLTKEAGETLKTCVEHYYRPHWPISSPLINSLGKMGPCGFIPNTVQGERGTARLARFDEVKQEIVRGPHTGLCLDAELRSTLDQRRGEAIVNLADRDEWLGFVDDDVTRAMVYRNSFRQNDAWCRSGDLMSVDRLGFFYFLGHTGTLPDKERTTPGV
ncbi:AMP-binding enzyme [Toxoplasma gondii TgCatPRC2]|uniref:AMP-binding enzyme n=1 Tax=Toxoplasma gondii TgCatPRC2 TaxID=1130821 RepID=A0A151HRC1_TOXGO|nr:AMP-binding enzyme [Toxoplasma gondii TgCatPRC2]